ncbi:aspartate/glutamate/uridylate kinase [Tanacetum coccineum]
MNDKRLKHSRSDTSLAKKVRRVQAFNFYGFAFTLSSCGRTNGLACCVTGSETFNSNDMCAVKPCFECLESALPVKLREPRAFIYELLVVVSCTYFVAFEEVLLDVAALVACSQPSCASTGGCHDGKGWDSNEVDQRLNYNAHLDLNNENCGRISHDVQQFMDKKPSTNTKCRRVVFKISGDALAGTESESIDPKVAMLISREVSMSSHNSIEKYVMYSGSGATEVEGCGHQIDFLSELRRAMNH